MSDAKYRALFVGLGLLFVAVIVGGFVFGSPDGDGGGLPDVIEGIRPAPGSQVPMQTAVEVDVPVGYRVEMFADNFRIPDSELRFVEGTGVYSWNPAQSSVLLWGAGEHTILVRWRRLGGLPDDGQFEWSFRVF